MKLLWQGLGAEENQTYVGIRKDWSVCTLIALNELLLILPNMQIGEGQDQKRQEKPDLLRVKIKNENTPLIKKASWTNGYSHARMTVPFIHSV